VKVALNVGQERRHFQAIMATACRGKKAVFIVLKFMVGDVELNGSATKTRCFFATGRQLSQCDRSDVIGI